MDHSSIPVPIAAHGQRRLGLTITRAKISAAPANSTSE